MRRFLIHISQPPSIAFRACRIADAIEQYVAWLVENRCAARSVLHRVPIWYILVSSPRPAGRGVYDVARNAVKQMLRVVLSGYAPVGARRERSEPFADIATAFFTRKSVI